MVPDLSVRSPQLAAALYFMAAASPGQDECRFSVFDRECLIESRPPRTEPLAVSGFPRLPMENTCTEGQIDSPGAGRR
jgi:hypothetical protein